MKHELSIAHLKKLEQEQEKFVREQIDILNNIKESIELLVKDRELGKKDNSFKQPMVSSLREMKRVSKSEAIEPIADAIEKLGRFVSKYEIIEEIGKPIIAISSTLSKAKKLNKRDIASYTPSGAQKHTLWGFNSWLISENNPKPEYLPHDKSDIEFNLNRISLEEDNKNMVDELDVEYHPKMRKSDKAEFALRQLKKVNSARDILEFLEFYDSEILTRNNKTFDEYLKSFTSILLTKVNQGDTFFSIKNEGGHIKYGLIEWQLDSKSEYYSNI